MPRSTELAMRFSWIKCPECGRRHYYYRRKTKDFVCNLCPCVFRGDYEAKTTYVILKERWF